MLRIGVGVWDVVELGRHYVLRVTLVIDSPKTDQFCGRLINWVRKVLCWLVVKPESFVGWWWNLRVQHFGRCFEKFDMVWEVGMFWEVWEEGANVNVVEWVCTRWSLATREGRQISACAIKWVLWLAKPRLSPIVRQWFFTNLPLPREQGLVKGEKLHAIVLLVVFLEGILVS